MRFLEKITAGIIGANGFDGFAEWTLPPGTEFMANKKWWGEGGKRPVPHQGLDLVAWRNRQGKVFAIKPGAVVPAVCGEIIVNILPDFIGKSIFSLTSGKESELRLHLYGHLVAAEGLSPGQRLEKGAIIGRVAAPAKRKTVRPHLHISIARVCEKLDFTGTKITWGNLATLPIELIDPAQAG